jgi:hypothetical protein
MATPKTRTPEQVRKEIEAEREQLAGAVGQLRSDLGKAASAAAKVKSRLPIGVALAGGVGATMRYLGRRRRRR